MRSAPWDFFDHAATSSQLDGHISAVHREAQLRSTVAEHIEPTMLTRRDGQPLRSRPAGAV
jgi:hypothetical protein